jgi:hypothetical protein
MKKLINLFSFSSPKSLFFFNSPFSTTSSLSHDPADTDKIDYTHYTSDIFRGWLYDECDYLSKQSVYSNCLQKIKYFKDRYVYVSVQKPGTQVLLKLIFRLEDGSFVEILPLVNITNVGDEILDTIIKANLMNTYNEWYNSNGSPKITKLITTGRLIFDNDPALDPDNDDSFLYFYSTIMHANSLCGKYYNPETKIFDSIGFLLWKSQSQSNKFSNNA